MDLTKHEEQVIEAYRQQTEAVRQGIDRILSVKGGQPRPGRERHRGTRNRQSRTEYSI